MPINMDNLNFSKAEQSNASNQTGNQTNDQTLEQQLLDDLKNDTSLQDYDARQQAEYYRAVETFFAKKRNEKMINAAKNYGIMNFGKYKGKRIEDVYKLDVDYCIWLHSKSLKFCSPSVKDELARLIK